MRFRVLFLLLIALTVLPGCLSKTRSEKKISTSGDTTQLVQEPVNLESFTDIHPNQVVDQIEVNGDVYALVQRPTINLPMSLPEDFEIQFVGVLKRIGDNEWVKLAQVEDFPSEEELAAGSEPKNIPFAIWAENGVLHIALVDQNGAGSGEGFFKVFRQREERLWTQESCGYYLPESGDFLDSQERLNFEFYQYNSVAKSYQSGPTFIRELGEERMVDEPSCDNAFLRGIQL